MTPEDFYKKFEVDCMRMEDALTKKYSSGLRQPGKTSQFYMQFFILLSRDPYETLVDTYKKASQGGSFYDFILSDALKDSLDLWDLTYMKVKSFWEIQQVKLDKAVKS